MALMAPPYNQTRYHTQTGVLSPELTPGRKIEGNLLKDSGRREILPMTDAKGQGENLDFIAERPGISHWGFAGREKVIRFFKNFFEKLTQFGCFSVTSLTCIHFNLCFM